MCIMNKNQLKKISSISAIVVIILGLVGFGTYKYNKIQEYNNLITTANKYMDSGEYDKAIALFNQSLQYKNDASIQRNIKLAANLKELKASYDDGIKLMNDKKYLEAIDKFNRVTKEDDKLYSSAQKKIEECKKNFITQNMELANNSFKNNKYDEANKYLDSILKIDNNNSEAKKLKDDVAKSQKEQQENEKQKSELVPSNNNTKVTFEQASNTVMNSINNKAPNTIIVEADKEIINKNGIDYYVVHVADNMGDHIATRGWYYVEVNTGKGYKMNLATNQLTPIN